jgi:uracil-DNA glycosylase
MENLAKAAKRHQLYKNVLATKGHIVIGRGNLKNPQILFIGESPGKTENRTGLPFQGRAGVILETWIKENSLTSYAIINSLPIIPLTAEGKIRKPTKDEIIYFRPYLIRLKDAIAPSYIICLGKTAAEALNCEFKLCAWIKNIGFIYHPAYYLRGGAKRDLEGRKHFKELIQHIK